MMAVVMQCDQKIHENLWCSSKNDFFINIMNLIGMWNIENCLFIQSKNEKKYVKFAI